MGYAWIGFTDQEVYGGSESRGQPNEAEDGWVWVTGETVTFTNWDNTEPNNVGNEDYARLVPGSSGRWIDTKGYYNGRYIVESDTPPAPIPEPSTILIWSLLGIIGILARAWRRRNR